MKCLAKEESVAALEKIFFGCKGHQIDFICNFAENLSQEIYFECNIDRLPSFVNSIICKKEFKFRFKYNICQKRIQILLQMLYLPKKKKSNFASNAVFAKKSNYASNTPFAT